MTPENKAIIYLTLIVLGLIGFGFLLGLGMHIFDACPDCQPLADELLERNVAMADYIEYADSVIYKLQGEIDSLYLILEGDKSR